MGEKSIRVDEEVWAELMKMKLEQRMGSINEVIKHLLQSQEVH